MLIVAAVDPIWRIVQDFGVVAIRNELRMVGGIDKKMCVDVRVGPHGFGNLVENVADVAVESYAHDGPRN